MATLATMREDFPTRIDPQLPVRTMKQELVRQISRRVQRYDYRHRASSGDRVGGIITFRRPRENQTNVQWIANSRRGTVSLRVIIQADIAGMGVSHNEARRIFAGWFRGL